MLLTTFGRPSHIVIYAPRDSLTCRLPATSLNLGIVQQEAGFMSLMHITIHLMLYWYQTVSF
ncbi:hypothetical protein C9426_27120 [Serratia sp. S1B]|nr:hypothetical protein C9426_27120 [Serratia sp. S1B]